MRGGTYFFTVVTYERRPLFEGEVARSILGDAFRECQERFPFQQVAVVLLPDHLHSIWSLPSGDDNYSGRWEFIKRTFTQSWLEAGGTEMRISLGQRRDGRRGIWQPKFWEHTIRDEEDFERHFDYIHFNPVKHGHAKCPREWIPSSFHRWVEAGVYIREWGCQSHTPPPHFDEIAGSVGE